MISGSGEDTQTNDKFWNNYLLLLPRRGVHRAREESIFNRAKKQIINDPNAVSS